MTMAPKNITTAELLALSAPGSHSSRPALLVKAWNKTARKWERATDTLLIAHAMQAANQNGVANLTTGETAFFGEINGTRVLVEVR